MKIPSTPKVEFLVKQIASTFGVIPERLLSKERASECIQPRFLLFVALRKLGYSYGAIGRICGNRDHTTVMNGIAQAELKWPELSKVNYFEGQQVDEEGVSPYQKNVSQKWKHVYEKFGGKCALCGFDDVVEVHHVKPRSLGGGDLLDNLLLLCPNHHAMWHLGLVEIKKIPTGVFHNHLAV